MCHFTVTSCITTFLLCSSFSWKAKHHMAQFQRHKVKTYSLRLEDQGFWWELPSVPFFVLKLTKFLTTALKRAIFVDLLLSRFWVSQLHELQHTRLPCSSLSPGVCSNLCPLSQRCHATISSSVTLFSCLQSFPVSGSFPLSPLFASRGQKEQYIFKNWWKLHCSFSTHSKLLLLSTQQANNWETSCWGRNNDFIEKVSKWKIWWTVPPKPSYLS